MAVGELDQGRADESGLWSLDFFLGDCCPANPFGVLLFCQGRASSGGSSELERQDTGAHDVLVPPSLIHKYSATSPRPSPRPSPRGSEDSASRHTAPQVTSLSIWLLLTSSQPCSCYLSSTVCSGLSCCLRPCPNGERLKDDRSICGTTSIFS